MFKNIAPRGTSKSVRRARRLRREMSLPEVLLWQVLNQRPGTLKFRRQHACGPYDLDFFCNDARLAIEVDGEAHDRGDRPGRDAARDAWLLNAGIRTYRVPARDVLNDLERVVHGVVAAALARLPLHHPAAPGGPPPRGELGEDWSPRPPHRPHPVVTWFQVMLRMRHFPSIRTRSKWSVPQWRNLPSTVTS